MCSHDGCTKCPLPGRHLDDVDGQHTRPRYVHRCSREATERTRSYLSPPGSTPPILKRLSSLFFCLLKTPQNLNKTKPGFVGLGGGGEKNSRSAPPTYNYPQTFIEQPPTNFENMWFKISSVVALPRRSFSRRWQDQEIILQRFFGRLRMTSSSHTPFEPNFSKKPGF